MKILIFYFIGLFFSKTCDGLTCFTCSSEVENCRDKIINSTSIEWTECSEEVNSCAIFYDSFTQNFYRGCSNQFFIQGLNYTEKCFLSSKTESVYCKCSEDFCNKDLDSGLEITIDYCNQDKCVHGTPVSDSVNHTCSCICDEGFSGDSCEIENFKCPEIGTFPDPKYCWIYYICSQGTSGIIKSTFSCPFKIFATSKYQLLFQYDPNSKTGTCVFPSVFKNYHGQICST